MKQPHICLDETLGVRYAILPGDPARLDRIAQQLEGVRELAYNREFRSLTGTYRGVPILAVSTGIGGSSAGICVEELHNIGVEAAIRIGSCGALQKGIGLGDLILGCGAIRDDGASKAYAPAEYPAAADMTVTLALMKAAESLKVPYQVGISVSTDSFWPGQERYDSFSGYVRTSYQGLLSDFQAMGCTNFEMENATLFTLASVMGLRAGSVCGVVAKRTESESIAPPEVYALAEERFQKTVKRALEMLIGHFMVTL